MNALVDGDSGLHHAVEAQVQGGAEQQVGTNCRDRALVGVGKRGACGPFIKSTDGRAGPDLVVNLAIVDAGIGPS